MCDCTLCHRVVQLDPRQSVWCPKSCGGTCPAPVEGLSPFLLTTSIESSISLPDSDVVRCIKCNAVLAGTDNVIDALRVGQEALDKANALRLEGSQPLSPQGSRTLTPHS